MPNMEMKFLKTSLDKYSLESRVCVELNSKRINVSPIELQIAYKLFLGSEKDIEDSRFLYRMFGPKIDQGLLDRFLEALKVKEKFRVYLNEVPKD